MCSKTIYGNTLNSRMSLANESLPFNNTFMSNNGTKEINILTKKNIKKKLNCLFVY